jgi:hypothetical protein
LSAIRIVKGYPISFLITVTSNSTPVDVNDGHWDTTVSLHYQTKVGPTPFDITPTPTGGQLLVDLDNTQTNQLNHLGTGYVLVVKAIKDDGTVNIQNEIPVAVKNDL